MDTQFTLSPQEMARYRATARQRVAQKRQSLATRRHHALEVARQAALLLKEHDGVGRVVLFGSLARDNYFSLHSDVDLAVWGLDEHLLYRVVSQLLDLDPTISIDLVRAEEINEHFLAVIEREGVDL
jgi:predicted nucleotidyltransferase